MYLKENVRWEYLVAHASDNDIAVKLDRAMSDIEKDNPALKGTSTLNLFSNLGADKSKIKDLIDNINKIDEKKFVEEDLIGRVYEYFLKIYAASGTKEDGEFYTPACVVKLIAELIEPYKGTVYDPCCGSGGMFVQSMKFVESHNGNKKDISILGQESAPETWKLCKRNLAIRGISHNLGEKNASTFTNDLHKNKTVNYIMANPPFNLKDWRKEDELTNDPRFGTNAGYTVMPPVKNANYAWILHMLSKLDVTNGIAGFLLANGALNAEGIDGIIRKEIIEKDKVEVIITLPRDMFYTTPIPVSLWILNMNKKESKKYRNRTNEVLFIDIRTWDNNVEEIVIEKNKKVKKTILSDVQIMKIKEIYESWKCGKGIYKDISELCRSVNKEEIKEKEYSLAPSQYIEFKDNELNINYKKEMARIQKEMLETLKEEEKSVVLIKEAFKEVDYELS